MGRYDADDPATRVGYIIADVFLLVFATIMIFGMVWY
jgi:hypothetical protein